MASACYIDVPLHTGTRRGKPGRRGLRYTCPGGDGSPLGAIPGAERGLGGHNRHDALGVLLGSPPQLGHAKQLRLRGRGRRDSLHGNCRRRRAHESTRPLQQNKRSTPQHGGWGGGGVWNTGRGRDYRLAVHSALPQQRSGQAQGGGTEQGAIARARAPTSASREDTSAFMASKARAASAWWAGLDGTADNAAGGAPTADNAAGGAPTADNAAGGAPTAAAAAARAAKGPATEVTGAGAGAVASPEAAAGSVRTAPGGLALGSRGAGAVIGSVAAARTTAAGPGVAGEAVGA